MNTNNKYYKIILITVLSLYSSCYLSTAAPANEGNLSPTNSAETSISSTPYLSPSTSRAITPATMEEDEVYDIVQQAGTSSATPKSTDTTSIRHTQQLQSGSSGSSGPQSVRDMEAIIDLANQSPAIKEKQDLMATIYKKCEVAKYNMIKEQIILDTLEERQKALGGQVDQALLENIKKQQGLVETLAEEIGRLDDLIEDLAADIEKAVVDYIEKAQGGQVAQAKEQGPNEAKKAAVDTLIDQPAPEMQQQGQQKILAVTEKQKNLNATECSPKAQKAQKAQRETVHNISTGIASIVQKISIRMNTHQYGNRTPENKDTKTPAAAGSQTVDARITPKSWDIWASGHMGNVNQGAANARSANSQTGFHGRSIGIDKIFANNSVFGLALSYGKSNTEYKSQISTGTTANEKSTSNYYQADIYAHHNFTDRLFVQLIGGIGIYGDGTTIGNMFDFSPKKFTFGYHGNATIGYSIFSGEDSNFAITPKLGVAYYYLKMPDSIFAKTDSSTFTTLGRFDGIAGLNVKMFNLNSNSNSNIGIIPEITAAFKLGLSDNVTGINADNIKLPVVKSTNSNDLSADALAAPTQLFSLGGALTVVTNNDFSINLNGSVDFAKQYFAMVGGISVKLSF